MNLCDVLGAMGPLGALFCSTTPPGASSGDSSNSSGSGGAFGLNSTGVLTLLGIGLIAVLVLRK